MIKKLFSGWLLFALFLLTDCSKKNSQNEKNELDDFVPIPEAQYNNSNYGVYRGVFVGSKGYISIMLNNSVEGEITWGAILKVDDIYYKLKPAQNVAINQATTLNFSEGANSFTFTVGANGANPAITNLVFNGHPKAQIAIVKSLSNVMVDLFECTYKENRTGGETGVLMLAMAFSKTVGLIGDKNLLSVNNITGTQTGGHFSGTATIAGAISTISGNVSSDVSTISGTFANSNGSGTWTGKRIL